MTLSYYILDNCRLNLFRDHRSYPEPDTPRSANTCSSHSHRRGSGQKVVAFSYYEHDAKMSRKRIRTGEIKESHFIEGILINIERLQEYYPGGALIIKAVLINKLCEINKHVIF